MGKFIDKKVKRKKTFVIVPVVSLVFWKGLKILLASGYTPTQWSVIVLSAISRAFFLV